MKCSGKHDTTVHEIFLLPATVPVTVDREKSISFGIVYSKCSGFEHEMYCQLRYVVNFRTIPRHFPPLDSL